jgi:hypothetical protein
MTNSQVLPFDVTWVLRGQHETFAMPRMSYRGAVGKEAMAVGVEVELPMFSVALAARRLRTCPATVGVPMSVKVTNAAPEHGENRHPVQKKDAVLPLIFLASAACAAKMEPMRAFRFCSRYWIASTFSSQSFLRTTLSQNNLQRSL